MELKTFPARSSGWLALAIAAVTALGLASILLFFSIGGIFGRLGIGHPC